MNYLLPSEIDQAIAFLKKSIPVAFPTETVYGLAASVFDEAGIEAIFQMKGRPSDNPLICHISSLDQLFLLAKDVPQIALDLASHFWPGPLTLVLKKQESVPYCVTGGLETVAVRMPRHPIAHELIHRFGGPLVGPSANVSGKPSSSRAEHVLMDFAGMQGGVIDGGDSEIGLESTVLFLAEEKPLILRPGSITPEQIAAVVGCEVGFGGNLKASPGTRYRHYAPKARVVLRRSFESVEFGEKQFLMSTEKRMGFHLVAPASLYALLRQADDEGCDEIVIVCREKAWNDLGFRDRILKASFEESLFPFSLNLD